MVSVAGQEADGELCATSDGGHGVAALVDTAVAFYSLEPILSCLGEAGLMSRILVPEKTRQLVAARLPALESLLIPAEHLRTRLGKQKALHRMLLLLGTRSSFSFQYRLLRHPSQHPGDWRYRAAYAAALAVPGLPHRSVNGFLQRSLRAVTPNLFGARVVLAASRNAFPHALCAKGLRTATVMESWDHPVKWPMGYRSEVAFAWNHDLAEDWRSYQGDSDTRVSYPFKLRSWLESNEVLWRPPCSGQSLLAVYAAGTSSHSYINKLHEFEIRLLDLVCRGTAEAGWRLLIKPKPNGRAGDFDQFLKRYGHVSVGHYRDTDAPNEYYLDESYNRRRVAEMKGASVLINALTTFGLDAALMGMPVLQLDCRACPELKSVAEGQTNHHIQRYLLGDSCLCLRPSGERDLQEGIARWLRRPDDRAARLTERIREWLRPAASLEQSVAAVVSAVRTLAESSPRAAAGPGGIASATAG